MFDDPAKAVFPPNLPLRLTPAVFRLLATTSDATAAHTTSTRDPEIVTVSEPSIPKPKSNGSSTRGGAREKKTSLDARQLRLNWLESISCPWPDIDINLGSKDSVSRNADSGWIIGVDPDLSGALAVLKSDNSPQVYDSPHLKVLVGKRVRKRLDVKSIIQLLQSVDAPIGTSVYIEQSIPYPKDENPLDLNKCIFTKVLFLATIISLTQTDLRSIHLFHSRMGSLIGWWAGGFGYGLWIGILVASGYSVVLVPSSLWKSDFKLTGLRSSKDDSRELATTLFPSMSSLLKRKKDHGRAEALLIAAFGKGLKVNHESSCILEKQENLQVAIF